MASKSEIRQSALRARRGLRREEIRELSGMVALKLSSLPEFESARTIASYVSKEDEVQTAEIIKLALKHGKRLIVPRAESSRTLRFFEVRSLEELSPGRFGVLEPTATGPSSIPVPLAESEAIIVPVVAWDERGNRIGYGKGYFDAELSSPRSAPAIGLALEIQRVDRIPEEPWDVPLDVIVTERRVLRFSKESRATPRSHPVE